MGKDKEVAQAKGENAQGMGQPEAKDKDVAEVKNEAEEVKEPVVFQPSTKPAHENMMDAITALKAAGPDQEEAFESLVRHCYIRFNDKFPDDVREKIAKDALFAGIMSSNGGLVDSAIVRFGIAQIGLDATIAFAAEYRMVFVKCNPQCEGHLIYKDQAEMFCAAMAAAEEFNPLTVLGAISGPNGRIGLIIPIQRH